MSVKIIIHDGIVQDVLSSNPVEVEIIDIDRDYEDYGALCKYEQLLYQDASLKSQAYTTAHFEDE